MKLTPEQIFSVNLQILKILKEIKEILERQKASKFRRLTVKQTAERLGISPKTIYNGLSSGTFPIKCKRVRGSVGFLDRDIDEYLENL